MRALLTLFLSGICIWLSAQTTDTEPILRLDLPMHDASIRNIDTDQQGRYLLTASFDKTAKLWDIATGKLIRTFRPPIGIENIGKLNAAAISPDGNTVAIGGYSQKKEHAIYIFDVTSGQMINWVPGQEGVILDLEYSSDGRYLAASRGKGSGIQVYRSSTYTEVFADRNYDNDTYGIAFDKSGRLATACIDGYIRLYDQNFKLLKQLKTSVGNWPFSLSFSPDGAHLAVGYEDSPVVQVLNAYDLSLEFTPDNTEADVRHNHLIHVAYSTDGAYLLAGGYYRKNIPIFRNNVLQGNLQFQIRKWSEAGRGSYTDITAGENTISCIKPIPGNQLVFSSHLPDWGVIDLTSNQRSLFQTTEVNLFLTTNIQHLRLSADGFELG
ncbi:MAG: peptidase C14, partial [Lewinella sp.]|nr:peptidase C14 [Lewinella sp.]